MAQVDVSLDATNFPAWPGEVASYIEQWQSVAPELFHVTAMDCPSGDQILGVTIGRFHGLGKKASTTGVYLAQPHAHEPAAIAGMVQVMHELITGKDLAGRPALMDRQRLLDSLTITFNPIGNPWGRRQTDVRCWDGSILDNRSCLLQAFGMKPASATTAAAAATTTGAAGSVSTVTDPRVMWPRVNEWQLQKGQPQPDPIGYVYEPVGDNWYVEPNRSRRSSYYKLFEKMDRQYDYHYWLDLHQTEFENRPINCEIWQSNRDMLTEDQLAHTQSWAQDIIEAWTLQGFKPGTAVHPSGTSEPMRTYFRDLWLPIQKRIHQLTVEVQNNSVHFNGIAQRDAVSCAIRQTLAFACSHPSPHS